MRGKFATEIGKQVGFAYTLRSILVELYFNNEYQGGHQINEHMKTEPNRVNVEKLESEVDTDAATITGG